MVGAVSIYFVASPLPASNKLWCQALLFQSFAELSRRGMGTVRLFVDLHNPIGAIHLYERAGMQITQLFHQYEKGKTLQAKFVS